MIRSNSRRIAAAGNYTAAQKEGEDTRGIGVTGMFTGWGLLTKGNNVEIDAGTPVEARTATAMTVKVGG